MDEVEAQELRALARRLSPTILTQAQRDIVDDVIAGVPPHAIITKERHERWSADNSGAQQSLPYPWKPTGLTRDTITAKLGPLNPCQNGCDMPNLPSSARTLWSSAQKDNGGTSAERAEYCRWVIQALLARPKQRCTTKEYNCVGCAHMWSYTETDCDMWICAIGYFLRALDLSQDDATQQVVANNLRIAQKLARKAHQNLLDFLHDLKKAGA
jgi:hypothetical protein